jgi:hypothetical protein
MNIKSIVIVTGLVAALHAQQPTPKPETVPAPAPRGGGGFGGFGGGGSSGSGGMPMMGGMMGGGVSGYATRLNSVVRWGNLSAGSITLFAAKPQKEMDELSEDLIVLAHIASRNLERSLGDKATEYRLGVPILMDNRLVQARYIEGFGILITVNVPFPVAPSGKGEKKADSSKAASEWDRVKASIYGGGDSDAPNGSNEGLHYDEAMVASLKKQMLDAMRNVANVRHMRSEEFVAVVVNGGPNAEDPSRNSVLTLRARKSAAEASPNEVTDKFEHDTESAAYLASATANSNHGTSLWGAGSNANGFYPQLQGR